MKKGKSIILAVVWVVILAWAILFFTSKGVLISSSERTGALGTILVCEYFTGTGVIKHEHLKTEFSVLGHEICPRIADLD